MAEGPEQFHVVLAVYRPEMAALERQLASVIGQTGCDVHVHLCVDGPMPQMAEVAALAAARPQCSVIAFPENRGPAATFLEGLAHVLSGASAGSGPRWFAFCDQDDVWHSEKLARLRAKLAPTGCDCVHSDARVVDAQLNVIEPSLFAFEQRERDPGPIGVFFRNNATGMTMLFGEALAEQIAALRHLRPRRWLHDHFTAFLAAAGRGLCYEDQPLVDYVQHGGNTIGAGRIVFSFPRGEFLDPQGEAAQILASGEALVRALLADGRMAGQTHAALAELHDLLSRRGVRSLVPAWRTLRRCKKVPRALFARLLWAKLAR